jgi:curved DNA-binding protein CbpA
VYLTCCKIVGVQPGSDPEVIKTAYRKAAKELHPDVNESEKAHQYFIILQNAYQYLIDHPYTPQEARSYRSSRVTSEFRQTRKYYQRGNRTTLREILKQSSTARTMYIFFHLFFIFVGLYLLISSVYDGFFHTVDKRADVFSAYFTLVSGLFFGIMLTTIFSISAVNYFRGR